MKAKAILALSACAMSLVMTDAAWAQDAGQAAQTANSDSNGMGADIVVTARRRAEDISKVPVSITAFSSQQLVAKNIVNVADLTKVTPGLNITGGGSRTNVFVTIRGQSRGVTGNVSPGVLTYFNEVPLPTYGSLISTYDMDNIQVLKGPQGTLFGRNSIGGAVLTYSKAPSYDFNGYLKGEIGQYANRTAEGAVNIPIIPEHVALRVAGQLSHQGGYTKTYLYKPYALTGAFSPNTGGAFPGSTIAAIPELDPTRTHNADEYDSTAFRASLLIEPVEGVKNVTVFDYTRVRGLNATAFDTFYPGGALYLFPPATLRAIAAGGNLGPPAIGGMIAENLIGLAQCGTSIACDANLFQQVAKTAGPRVSFGNTDPWASVTTIWGISNTTTIDLSDNVRLKNIFGYRTNDSYTNLDVDGTPLSVVDTQNRIRLKEVTEELQLSGSLFDNKLKYTVGGFYYKQSPNGLGGSSSLEINAFFGLAHSTSTSYFTDTSKAIYGQVDYSLDAIVPGLTATAGYRQTWDTSGGCVVAYNYTPFGALNLVADTPSDPIPSEAACRSGTLAAGVGNTAFSGVSSAVLPPREFKKGTYNLGLNWQITPSAMVYFAARRGYRAGSYNSPLYPAFLSKTQVFGPETLDDMELGTKLRFDTGGMSGSLDIAVFRGKDKDIQVPIGTSQLTGALIACIPEAFAYPGETSPLCSTTGGANNGRQVPVPNPTTYANAGTATLTGFEAQATLSPVAGLTLGAGVAHVHIKTDSIVLDPNLRLVLHDNGRDANIPTQIILRQQPAWTVTGNVYYETPDRWILNSKAFLNVDLHYRTDYVEGDDTIRGATSVDARVGLNDIGQTGLDAAVSVTNVFDKVYDYGTVGSAVSSGYRSSLRAAPRTVLLSLRYHWGS